MRKFTKVLPTVMMILLLSIAGLVMINRAQKTGGLSGTAARLASDVSGVPVLSQAGQALQKGIDSLQGTVQAVASQVTTARAAVKAAETDTARKTGSQPSTVRVTAEGAAPAKTGGAASAAVVLPAVPVDTVKPAAPFVPAAGSAVAPKVQSVSLTDYWGTTGMDGLKVYEYGKALLDSDQRAVYDSLKQAVENLQDSVTITTPCGLSDFNQAFEYYNNDHVEVFYMHSGISYAYRKSGSKTTYVVKFTYDYNKNTIASMRQKLDSAALSMIQKATAKVSSGSAADYNRELALHDALIRLCSYDSGAQSNPYGHLESFTAYGAIVNGSAVCDGYARAMKLLLSSVDIRCLYVTGTAVTRAGQGSHAWNMVYVPGGDGTYHWYYLDATFDDPVVYSNGTATSKQVVSYNYFNFIMDKSGLGTQHILGSYSASDPQDSENYASMPQIG